MLIDKIREIIKDSLEHNGYEIVQITFNKGKRRSVLQVMIDRIDGKLVKVSDCENASHAISLLLDMEDPIKSAYHLEVSSAGIDRPLVKLSDYEKFKGFLIKLSTKIAVDNRKNFKAVIIGVKDNNIIIDQAIDDVNIKQYIINIDNVSSAKLVLTDELIKFHQKLYQE